MATNPDWYDPKFDPYNLAIGKIATMWAVLEFIINEAIWALQNVDAGAGACVTAQIIGPAPRMRALIALLDYRASSPKNEKETRLFEEFNKLYERIDKLGRQRNQIVHHQLLWSQKGGAVRAHISADRKLDFEYRLSDLDEMDKLWKSIRDVSNRFRALYFQALDVLPSWPRTQFEQSTRGFQSLHLEENKNRAEHQSPSQS